MSESESRSKGKGKSTPSPTPNLQFVNIIASGVSEGEKKRQKRVVRSAAMKSFRREQKSQQVQKKEKGKAEPKSAPASLPGATQHNVIQQHGYFPEVSLVAGSGEQTDISSQSDGYMSEHSWFTAGSPALGDLNIEDVNSNSNHVDLWTIMPPESPFINQTGYVDYLGAGSGDPFDTSIRDAGPQAEALLDHSIHILWPGLRLPSRPAPDSGNQLTTPWHETLRESPIILHAFLYGAIVHLDILRFPIIKFDNPIRLHHKVQFINLLRAEVSRSPELQGPLEHLIFAVLCLTLNEFETTLPRNSQNAITSPFTPPLISLQWFDVYGRTICNQEHMVVLRGLVGRRGGLEAIELDGLAEILSLSDLLNACQYLTKPSWPLLQRTLDHVSTPPLNPTPTIPRYQLQHLAQGFTSLCSIALTAEMSDILQIMAELTVTIDGYFRGSNPICDLQHLVDRRQVCQHRLLMLSSGEDLESEEVEMVWLYEAMRWAMLIYSIAVTFPLPPHSGIFHTLSSNLQKTLTQTTPTNSQSQPTPQQTTHHNFLNPPSPNNINISKPLLWILLLGGIASSGTPNREWYVDNIRSTACELKLREWDDVVAELRSFLWLDCSCEVGGRGVWDEVLAGR